MLFGYSRIVHGFLRNSSALWLHFLNLKQSEKFMKLEGGYQELVCIISILFQEQGFFLKKIKGENFILAHLPKHGMILDNYKV